MLSYIGGDPLFGLSDGFLAFAPPSPVLFYYT